MDTRCIEIRCGSARHDLSYGDLFSPDVQSLLDECYALGAEVRCLCNPDRPVPMHLRRVRIRPPTYTVVTNPLGIHHPDCPRFRQSRHPSASHKTRDPRAVEATPNHTEEWLSHRRMFVPTIDQLNDAQREAATHQDGPCMVVAAAGSGKTAMLIARIQYLIDQGVKPGDILACTFTRKAAQEMTDRLLAAVGERGKGVTIGTIHSVAYRMVTPELGEDWRVLSDPTWMIERVLEEPSSKNPHGVGPVMKLGEAISAIAKAKADALGPRQVSDPLAKVYAAYEALKAERKVLDFEDMILHAIRLFRSDEAFAKRWRQRWRYVMVDEFQDTNTAQWLFLLELVKAHNNLFVVGDDWQSIYYFRGARPDLMKEFLRRFPDAKRVTLETNYRSHDLIVDVGRRIIRLNDGHQLPKRVVAHRPMPEGAIAQIVTVRSDLEEARFVAQELQRLRKEHGVSWSDCAVLYRTNIQSRLFEEALADADIPYHVVGDKHFYESPDVKIILDYLRTTQDTSDPTVWGHLLNRPKRYIPIDVVHEVQHGGWEVVVAHPKCRAFVTTIDTLRRIEEPSKAIQWLVDNHPGLVRQQDEDEPIKWVDSLIASASRYQTVSSFLRFVNWIIEKSKEPKDEAVQLMTIHKAKGLEWTTVFVAGLAEGLLPHKKALKGEELREETRLCYVAATRARDNLYLLSAKWYGDKEREVSRYVNAVKNP
ncbi:UvrD-helicase domain-containing protein [Alicyclobacillus mali]|uniref:DNA 3'-5' helicase n=2 Tax=Alicyclobacillus mali (ex Roth et al. 2021) TaxID=1123961 RepID=A0ABS0EZI7_9BACL|nr:UvrD-helicase domain-containing protein [Alicyclobacillus mali (ex Roth et al. 2021)]